MCVLRVINQVSDIQAHNNAVPSAFFVKKRSTSFENAFSAILRMLAALIFTYPR